MQSIQEELERLERSALTRVQTADDLPAVVDMRHEFFGKKGVIGKALRSLGKLPEADRPKVGQEIHQIKARIEEALKEVELRLQQAEKAAVLESGRYDVTLPGRWLPFGAMHPLRIVERDVIQCLRPLGFEVVSGPLVEHDWYNFEALNMAPDHPARDMQDTFFLTPEVVLRTQTSNIQIRTMQKQQPPLRILAPGMVFRRDEIDPTHSPVFHQIEGLWVDEKASFCDLKGVLQRLITGLFGPQATTRFRPSYFPFTEPSAEVDVSCVACARLGSKPQASCRTCRGSGWLEILGAGMVHPDVLRAVGYDPDKVQGFAFGVGVERLAILRWGIDDIRSFYENDLRFIEQFASERQY